MQYEYGIKFSLHYIGLPFAIFQYENTAAFFIGPFVLYRKLKKVKGE